MTRFEQLKQMNQEAFDTYDSTSKAADAVMKQIHGALIAYLGCTPEDLHWVPYDLSKVSGFALRRYQGDKVLFDESGNYVSRFTLQLPQARVQFAIRLKPQGNGYLVGVGVLKDMFIDPDLHGIEVLFEGLYTKLSKTALKAFEALGKNEARGLGFNLTAT